MKNLILHLFFALVVCSLVSCSNEENAKNNNEPAERSYNLEKMTQEYNNQHRNIPAEYFESNVDFGISEQNLVLLIGKSGNYKTSFKVQLDNNALIELGDLSAGNFKVAYFGRELILSNGEESYYFTVNNKEEYPKIASGSELFKAIGIANWKNEKFQKSSKAMAFKIVDKGATCTCVSTETKKDCNSGGPGAVSCSQGDCSVTCSDGHYACCNEQY